VTISQLPATLSPLARRAAGAAEAIYVTLFTAAVLLWWLCNSHVTILPVFAPWDFSFVEFLSAWLTLFWYVRGLAVAPAEQRPSLPRQISFFAGIFVIYAVLETRFEYLAEHQFFYNRIQHVIMHHVGPFLIALSWPGETLWQGMPAPLRRIASHRLAIGTVRVLQQPLVAGFLFSGTFFFWLIPAVHFRAMIDPDLFALMNWTMVVEGILFWCLVLDPRPSPPARASFAARIALAFAVMFPQIIGGAVITFTQRDLYSFYDLCGRIYPNLGPHVDQAIGGLIIWIPPAMMSVLAVLLVLNMLRLAEERTSDKGNYFEEADRRGTGPLIDASRWTGS
jgi:putative membrane protein